jgi:hypothetical protein
MRNLLILFALFFLFSCNLSNQDYELPSGYMFFRGGGETNSILRDHDIIIRGGAVDYSYNEDYIFFSIDCTKATEPRILSKELLFYYIHDIKKDTLYKPVSYKAFKEFIKENKIDKELDISKQRY